MARGVDAHTGVLKVHHDLRRGGEGAAESVQVGDVFVLHSPTALVIGGGGQGDREGGAVTATSAGGIKAAAMGGDNGFADG